jgi:hypothetical protein
VFARRRFGSVMNSCGWLLLRHGIDQKHDEALQGLGQAADGFGWHWIL